MKRIGNNGDRIHGTYGVNLGHDLVNDKDHYISDHGDIDANYMDHYFNIKKWRLDRSHDDDSFRASYWKRYYHLLRFRRP